MGHCHTPVLRHVVQPDRRSCAHSAVPAFSNFMHFIGCVACPPFPLRLSLCRVLRVSAFPVSDLNFIGWPRSGSSLFAAILEAHPNAAVANEYDTPLVFSEYNNDAAPIVRRDA
eukprot:3249423-Prymnesium_polylepis.1